MGLSKGNLPDYFNAIVRPGWTVVDVGANDGEFTELAAKMGASVVAIEPDTRCHARLDTLASQYPDIQIYRLAAGQEDRPALLHRGAGSQQSSLYKVELPAALPDMEVEVRPLDTLVLYADLVKIDVQGSEMDVLTGAKALLAACPNWVIEIWPTGLVAAGTSALAVVDRMYACGFTATLADGSRQPIESAELKEYAGREHHGHEHINVAWVRP